MARGRRRQTHRRGKRSARWREKSTVSAGVRQMILAHPDQFVEAMTSKLLMYALGRNVQFYDGPPCAPSLSNPRIGITRSPR